MVLLSVTDIDEKLSHIRDYRGCFNSNELPELSKGHSYYCILVVPLKAKEGHFVCFEVNKDNTINYFDPYGTSPFQKLKDWFDNNGIKDVSYSEYDIEGDNSTDCGPICCYLIEELNKGRSVEDIYSDLNLNEEKLDDNDKIVEKEYFGGLITPLEFAKRSYHALKGPRKIAPPQVRKFIEQYGDGIITSLELHRTPIDKGVKLALDILSYGGFEKNKMRLNYDQVFHLYMRIELSNGQKFVLEKNQVVQIKSIKKTEDRIGEKKKVDLQGKKITFLGFMNHGEQAQGENFWLYDGPGGNNCQFFVYTLLKTNNLLTSDLYNFLYQDAGKLFESLPITKKVSNFVTNLAGRFDILLHGKGLF